MIGGREEDRGASEKDGFRVDAAVCKTVGCREGARHMESKGGGRRGIAGDEMLVASACSSSGPAAPWDERPGRGWADKSRAGQSRERH